MLKLIIENIKQLIKIYRLKKYYEKIVKKQNKIDDNTKLLLHFNPNELREEYLKKEEKRNRYFYKRFMEKK